AVRQRPAPLRSPADRLRQGRGAALPHDDPQQGRPAVRLGLPRAARRRCGWDSQWLRAEVEAERLLAISGKADILKMGIDTFNEACRDSVLRYTKEWEEYVTRQARWVDF